MKKIKIASYVSMLFLTLSTINIGFAQVQRSVIEISLSYKIVLDPTTGRRPAGATEGNIINAILGMNKLFDSYYRGYQFRINEIMEVGSRGDRTGPSKWFDTNFFAHGGSNLKDQMQREAKATTRYHWRNNAINIYLTDGISGGICSFPGGGDEIVIIGGRSSGNAALTLHELGHYFNLCHTQGCPCGDCNGRCTESSNIKSDRIDDTLPDKACWNRDDISRHAFRKYYNQASAHEQRQVDNVYENIMSYHHLQGSTVTRLTEGQLDQWTETANLFRHRVLNGKTRIVGNGGYDKVAQGISAARNQDIVLLGAGNYDEPMTIRKPLTLRATRKGYATIGVGVSSRMAAPTLEDSLEIEHTDLLVELVELGVIDNDTYDLSFPGENHESHNHQSDGLLAKSISMTAYPNPFSTSTTLEFYLPDPGTINIVVRDVMGKEVAILANKKSLQAGKHHLEFRPAQLPNGVYMAILQTPGEQVVQKIILSR